MDLITGTLNILYVVLVSVRLVEAENFDRRLSKLSASTSLIETNVVLACVTLVPVRLVEAENFD